MKRLLFLLPAMFIPCAGFAEVVNLQCDGHNIIVDFLEDGAMITVDGSGYTFSQEYDAPVVFYNTSPWMRLEIGNRNYSTRYTFAAIVADVPTYMPCEEVQ